jgi:hypothetical protein
VALSFDFSLIGTLIELAELNGRDRLKGENVRAVLTY